MAHNCLEVNNSTEMEDMSFTVSNHTKVSAVPLLKADPCTFFTQFCCLISVFASGYWMSTCSPEAEKKKNILAVRTRPNNSLSRGKYLFGAKIAVLCIGWPTQMCVLFPLAENSISQRDKPAPPRGWLYDSMILCPSEMLSPEKLCQ